MSTSTRYLNEVSTTTNTWWRLPALAVVAGLIGVTIATMLLLQGVEPFATWYYNFAWYPVLLAGDGLVALTGGAGRGRKGEFLLLGNPKFLVTVLAWSSVVWLFYELFNFRLQNWYYVFLPADRVSRWAGTVIAFATVLPAVFVAEAVLNGAGVAKRVRWPSFTVTSGVITVMRVAGLIMLALVLVWPRYFFPLVWGATMLLVEPENYRRSRDLSLLADLEQGKPGRLLRLLLGGACIGFIWELLNINARGKWIYTVPGIEELKLFEMPVPGFFGFPPFAVECFILWQALVLAGVAVPRIGNTIAATPLKRIVAAVGGVVFSIGVLIGMERLTVDSYTPRVENAQLRTAGYDGFSVANAVVSEIQQIINADAATAAALLEQARMAGTRGIGNDNAALLNQVGVNSLRELAAQDWRLLDRRLEELTGRDFVDARVRVWIRGARRSVALQ